MSHLAHFAAQPHPIGSEANHRARDYLAGTLAGLGGEVQIEHAAGMFNRGRLVRAGNVQNIVATFRGRANSRAVLLVSHYDSVPEGPGAADAGAGVVSILETVRAVRAGQSLQNDVIVLFTDGEDLSELKTTGVAALNFAFTETFQNYHTRLDTRENLDPRSVQHMGANVLALTRHFGNMPLARTLQPDRVYFNWRGHSLVVYPAWLVWFLMFVTFALLALAWRLRPERGGMRRMLGSVGAFILLFIVVAGGMLLTWGAIKLSSAGRLQRGDTLSNQLLFVGLVLTGFTCGAGLLRGLERKLGSRDLAAGLLLAAAILAAIASYLLPGSSYLFQWPVFFGAGSVLMGSRTKQSFVAPFCGSVTAAATLLIVAPLMYLFFVGLGLNMASLLAAATLLTLLLAVAWPCFDFILRPSRATTVCLLLCALALVIGGVSLSGASARYPRPDTLFYSLNADRGEAKWVSYDAAADSWTANFLGTAPQKGIAAAFTAGSERECLTAAAPLAPLGGPVATVIGSRVDSDVRTLNLHLASAGPAHALILRLPGEAELLTVKWSGRVREMRPGAKGKDPWTLRFDAVPPEGVNLELRVRGETPLDCWVADSSLGLPEIARAFGLRSDDLMAGSGSDVTLVVRQYVF